MQQGNCNIYTNEPHRIEHSPDFSEYVNGSENEANSHFTNTGLETTEEHQFGNTIYFSDPLSMNQNVSSESHIYDELELGEDSCIREPEVSSDKLHNSPKECLDLKLGIISILILVVMALGGGVLSYALKSDENGINERTCKLIIEIYVYL